MPVMNQLPPAYHVLSIVLCLVVADCLRGETPRVDRAGTVISIESDGSTEVQMKVSVPFQRDQQLLVYRRPQEGTEPSLVGTFQVASVRGDRVFGVVRPPDAAVGDIVPLPRFLDTRSVSDAATLRDYVMRIAELDAMIEALRTGNRSFHTAFRKSLEADRIAATIVTQDAKRRVEEAVSEARRQQSEAEAAAASAIDRARLAEQARKIAQEDRRIALARVKSLEEDRDLARENLRETVSLVEGARRDYEGLLDLKLATQKEVAEEKDRILREREDLDKDKGELADGQRTLAAEREAFAIERDEGLRRIADRLASAEKTFVGELHAKWKAMDDVERAKWLLIRLSSADGFEEPDAPIATVPAIGDE